MILNLAKLAGVYRLYERYLLNQISNNHPPKHIGIILDGNRRWASSHAKPRWMGHIEGANNTNDILEWCHELKIKVITLYALSEENFDRSKDELDQLLSVIGRKLDELLTDPKIDLYDVNVKIIGDKTDLNNDLNNKIEQLENKTKDHVGHFLNIALAYGGRSEIVDVVKTLSKKSIDGEIDPNSITQDVIEKHLSTSHLPYQDPDLIIRTSGESRLSGFLLWQSAYSELLFLDVYWPDFRKIDLMRAIRTFQKRNRRYGK